MVTYLMVKGDIWPECGIDVCTWFATVEYFMEQDTYHIEAEPGEFKKLTTDERETLARYTILQLDGIESTWVARENKT